ncbi:hypothetical protein HNR01_005580 [Methylorubrum rhodesianum]|jgi:hypothetical protein|uniref:Uncharacterized protein n=1 Tax=Methylorubrum rhodesianum TaxID=29427 RepID=A0ABU9Z672_9HYPH|nr:hypothetical protein [Methylorubrum rhodesianum]MBB5765919.1 hypothetical protein [Methylorubrum rhodesianum]MBK3406743.1 hypothetical protein [Methylorubrum rhodesianum]MBY0144040.1 hypothetical protein [Methylorubrum populi]
MTADNPVPAPESEPPTDDARDETVVPLRRPRPNRPLATDDSDHDDPGPQAA